LAPELRDGLDQAIADWTAPGEPVGQEAASAIAELGNP
jgi:hypothetical protein